MSCRTSQACQLREAAPRGPHGIRRVLRSVEMGSSPSRYLQVTSGTGDQCSGGQGCCELGVDQETFLIIIGDPESSITYCEHSSRQTSFLKY